MQTALEMSFAELKKHIADVEREIETVEQRLPAALREAALDVDRSEEVAKLRARQQELNDRLTGLRDLAATAEHRELNVEIERREAAYDRETQRVEELRRVGTRADRVIEGTGTAFRAAVRADKEERNRDFSAYEAANIAHIDERAAIDALITRRDELPRRVQC